MGQILHGSATTTEAIRRAIQNSQESLRALANRHGINQKTVAKWKNRATASDLKTGPKEPKSTVLTVEDEAIVVAFRKHTLLPLDDCLYSLQATIPHLTRSSLHRCLQRHGISRLPDVEGDKPEKRKFKAYPIGYFHIDIAEVQTAEGKLYLYVAIDRTSKFAFVQLVKKTGRTSASTFLEALIAAVPYKIHTVLTDNGIQFTFPPRYVDGPTATYMTHMFDMRCRENGIEHRLTKIKCFLFRFAIFFFCARVTARQRARSEVRSLPRSLYRRSSFAAPVRAFDAGLEPRGVQPATKWA
jgi:transposase-like protein